MTESKSAGCNEVKAVEAVVCYGTVDRMIDADVVSVDENHIAHPDVSAMKSCVKNSCKVTVVGKVTHIEKFMVEISEDVSVSVCEVKVVGAKVGAAYDKSHSFGSCKSKDSTDLGPPGETSSACGEPGHRAPEGDRAFS